MSQGDFGVSLSRSLYIYMPYNNEIKNKNCYGLVLGGLVQL